MIDAVMYLWPTLELYFSFKMPQQPTGNRTSITYMYSIQVKNKIAYMTKMTKDANIS